MSTDRLESAQPTLPGARRLLLAVLILIAGVAAFYNSCQGVFLYDDLDAISNNPYIRKLWPLSDALSLPLWNSGFTVDGRPVLSLSFALNYAITGPKPWGFELVNVGIHLVAALLLFGLVRNTLVLPQFRSRFGTRADWLAAAVALLWMVHPLQTESVTYIVQRAESLAGLFFLATMYFAIKGIHSLRPWPWYAVAITCSALGIGTKESVMTVPFALFCYDVIFLTGSVKETLRKRWMLYLCLAATWVVALWTIFGTWEDKKKAVGLFTPLSYAASQPMAILYYLWLCVWPHPLVLHYRWPLQTPLPATIFPGLIVLGLIALTLWAIRRRSWIGFAGAWFFICLAPTTTIVPLLQRLQEHRMYLPLVSIVLVGVFVADELIQRASKRVGTRPACAVGTALLLMVAVAFGVRTHLRNHDYSSEVRMWTSNAHYRPNSEIAQLNLGATLVEKGDYRKGVQHLLKAISLAPGYTDAYNNLGVALHRLGHIPQAEACLKQCIELSPKNLTAHVNLLDLYRWQGNFDKGVEQFRKIVHINPNVPVAYKLMAMLLQQKGDVRTACQLLQRSLQISPNDAEALNSLGAGLLQLGSPREAVGFLQKALDLDPNCESARQNLVKAVSRELMAAGSLPSAGRKQKVHD